MYSKKAISDSLTNAGIAIHNTLEDQEIAALVALYGYGPDKMAEGQALLDRANGAVQAQVAATGGCQTATAELTRITKEAYLAYQGLREVARAAFGRRSPTLTTLGLNRRIPSRQGEFVTMATALFDNVLGSPDLSAAVGRYYTNDRLAAEKAKITAMDAALKARAAAKGQAQQATQDQHAAVATLQSWIGAFRRVARVALHDQPQLLEKLGVLVRNSRTPAQRQAPLKAAQTRKANREALTVVAPAAPAKETDTQNAA